MRAHSAGMILMIAVATVIAIAASSSAMSGDAGMRALAGGWTDAGVAAPRALNLLAPIRPPAQQSVDRNYKLVRAKDGSEDLTFVATGFEARIHRDGNVTFRDRHFTVLSFLPWLPLPTAPGTPTVESTFRSLLGKPATAPPGTATAAGSSTAMSPTAADVPDRNAKPLPMRPDLSEICVFPRPCFFDAAVVFLGVSGGFDLTDEVMRLAGQDPYRYEKAQFMVGTRDLRERMALRTRAEDIGWASRSISNQLAAIARDQSLTTSDRRQRVVSLRDEIDATTAEGRAARERIGRWLDEQLPPPDGGR